MRKRKLISLLVLLMTAVTGAWADDYLYLEVNGTSATVKYGADKGTKPYYREDPNDPDSYGWYVAMDEYMPDQVTDYNGKKTLTTVTIDASCQNYTGTTLESFFDFWSGLTTINNLENLNTSEVTNMKRMFAGCSSLTSLDPSSWNTAKVTNMYYMFNSVSVETLDLSGWNTSSVTNMYCMFYNCSKLETIYVGDGWSTASVTNGDLMFGKCTSLPGFDSGNVTHAMAKLTTDGGYLTYKAPEPEPSTYTVTLKEGTEDATSWTIAPAEATTTGVAQGTEVTATYSGTKKVKSVKAVKKAAAPGPVEGNFTINANGDKVSFAPGNLQATTTDLGVTWTWGFAEHQWDYVGNAAANNAINGNGTVSENGTVDLFCWVGEHSAFEGAAQYGISNSTSANQYGNTAGEPLKSDWGENIGDGTTWRTLTNDEWVFLLTRTTGGTVFGTTDTNYTLATINTDGTGVDGLILFPDGVDVASSEVTTVGEATDNWRTKCTSAEWAALEAKGCVFLPCADSRAGADYSSFHEGCYWSASSKAKNNAYLVYFRSNLNPSSSSAMRVKGYSVRLVKAAE